MDEPVKVETSIPEDVYSGIPCPDCDRNTRHKVLAQTCGHWEYAEGAVDVYKNFKIVQCQGCLTISFCETHCCSEEMDYDDNGNLFYPESKKYYPNRITGRSVMREANLLPHGVYLIYEEAHSALCAQLSVLSGLGIRAIVEAVCKDKEMVGRNLQEKIDALAQQGLVTAAGAGILHNLRFMGNASAHEIRTHSQKELNAAFDVIEYLLQGVYVLPRQAAHLPISS